ncbi:MAG: hypothetical protein ACRD9R_17615, partial [Pyrinomonadaceae bacterium]
MHRRYKEIIFGLLLGVAGVVSGECEDCDPKDFQPSAALPYTPCHYPHFQVFICKPQAKSCSLCQPRQSVCQPGSPSLFRPMKP